MCPSQARLGSRKGAKKAKNVATCMFAFAPITGECTTANSERRCAGIHLDEFRAEMYRLGIVTLPEGHEDKYLCMYHYNKYVRDPVRRATPRCDALHGSTGERCSGRIGEHPTGDYALHELAKAVRNGVPDASIRLCNSCIVRGLHRKRLSGEGAVAQRTSPREREARSKRRKMVRIWHIEEDMSEWGMGCVCELCVGVFVYVCVWRWSAG